MYTYQNYKHIVCTLLLIPCDTIYYLDTLEHTYQYINSDYYYYVIHSLNIPGPLMIPLCRYLQYDFCLLPTSLHQLVPLSSISHLLPPLLHYFTLDHPILILVSIDWSQQASTNVPLLLPQVLFISLFPFFYNSLLAIQLSLYVFVKDILHVIFFYSSLHLFIFFIILFIHFFFYPYSLLALLSYFLKTFQILSHC